MQDPSAPPAGADSETVDGEGGPEKAIQAIGEGLASLAQAIPDFGAVLDAFTHVVDKLQGGGSPDSGAVGQEQGASGGAVPMNMKGA